MNIEKLTIEFREVTDMYNNHNVTNAYKIQVLNMFIDNMYPYLSTAQTSMDVGLVNLGIEIVEGYIKDLEGVSNGK